MTHTVIIGGGTAGLPAAYELAEVAREGERITVVANRAAFRSGAAAPWTTALGSAEFDLARSLRRRGIGFSAAGARRLHPERNQLELGDGQRLDYDFAVIAAGPRPAYEEIEGLGPGAHTQSLCEPDHVAGCIRNWNRFLASPGPVIVGAVQGASCFAPAYESALLIDRELRAHRLRERSPMTFVTSEPYVGHLGVGGIADSRVRIESALRERDIAWIADARVERIERDRMHIAKAGSGRTHSLAFSYAMLMPPFRGIDAVAGIDGLADARGFILVDEFLRNPRYPNVYAAGVTVASDAPRPATASPEPRKTAYVIDSMVSAVVRNIRDALDGRPPSAGAEWNAVRVADLGASGLAFLAGAAPALRPAHGVAAGDWVQMSRCASCDAGN